MRFQYPHVSLILRSYGRPLRTKRMLDCIMAQTMTNFELVFMGDACPAFKELTRSDWFSEWCTDFNRKGNRVFWMNNVIGGRDYGAKVTNQAIRVIVRGAYTMFADNDDVIKPEHVEFYYKTIRKTQLEFVYNPVLVSGPDGPWQRHLELKRGCVGHAELIVKTEFLKKMPPHEKVYGQDWLLVENMMARTALYQKGDTPFPTYVVMSSHNYQEPGFENDK